MRPGMVLASFFVLIIMGSVMSHGMRVAEEPGYETINTSEMMKEVSNDKGVEPGTMFYEWYEALAVTLYSIDKTSADWARNNPDKSRPGYILESIRLGMMAIALYYGIMILIVLAVAYREVVSGDSLWIEKSNHGHNRDRRD